MRASQVKGIVGETVQHLLATHENLEVLEDRSEALRAGASTFHRQARTVKVRTRSRFRQLRRISCVVLLVLLAVGAAPLIQQHWDVIQPWFASIFPPPEPDCSSDDYGSGGGSNDSIGNGSISNGSISIGNIGNRSSECGGISIDGGLNRSSSDGGGLLEGWEWRWPWS